jgi:hypothetical protein
MADHLMRLGTPEIHLTSARGILWFNVQDQFVIGDGWIFVSNNNEDGDWPPPQTFLGFQLHLGMNGDTTAPHWFAMLTALAIAATPWLRWRFSLRTLLIATTLVAVVLGLIVWLSR